MAHTRRCGSARTEPKKCKCSCGGDAHGGKAFGSINTASGPTATVRTLTRDEVDSRDTISKSSPSKSGKDRTVIDQIVDRLTANPTVKDQVDSIAEIVGAQSVKAFNQYGHATSRSRLRVSHFLCGLLASLARAIDEFKQQLAQVPDRVISLILGSRNGLTLDAVAVRVAVHAAWRLIAQLPVFGQVDDLLRATRIAAVLACPDPDAHEEVLRYCLYPLGGDVISEVTEEEIRDHLPSRMNG